MEEEKKNWFLQWMEKPWIRTTAIVLAVSMVFGILGHGLYLRRINRAHAAQEAQRLEQEQQELQRQADFDEAYEKAREAVAASDYAAAVEHLNRCLELTEPGSTLETELLTTRASLNILLGNHREAVPDLDRAALSAPDSPEILLLKSQNELGLSDYETAQADMEKYLQAEPNNYDIRLSLTQLYELTGQYSLAADSYMELQKLRPGDHSIRIDTCRCLILSDRLPEAEALLEPMLQREEDENRAIALFLRAMIRMQKSDYTGAIEDYTAAIEAGYDPRICLEQITACAFILGDYKSVLQCADNYQKLWPEGSQAASFYQQIGVAAMSLEKYDRAEQNLTRSLELDPEYPGTYYYRALTRFSDSQWEPAAEDFTEALDRGYMTQTAAYNRGLCYAQTGDLSRALADLRAAAQGEDPELAGAAELLIPAMEKAAEEAQPQ